jgi:hypothetical protein
MNNKPTRYYSNKQEKTISKELKGKQQINSGATPFYKGDVKTEHFLIEAKTTTTPQTSFSIKKEWLDKIRNEAFATGTKIPVLAFNFEPNGDNFYILSGRGMFILRTLLEMEDNKDGE